MYIETQFLVNMYLRVRDGVENFQTINASLEAATTVYLLLMAVYDIGIVTVFAEKGNT